MAALDCSASVGRILPIGGGERLTAGEMFARVHRSLPCATLPLPLPAWLLRLGRHGVPRLRGPLHRLEADLIADNGELQRLLGINPRPFRNPMPRRGRLREPLSLQGSTRCLRVMAFHALPANWPSKRLPCSWARRGCRLYDRRTWLPDLPTLDFLNRLGAFARRCWPWLRIPVWVGLGLLFGFMCCRIHIDPQQARAGSLQRSGFCRSHPGLCAAAGAGGRCTD